jgi:hypothetical protein
MRVRWNALGAQMNEAFKGLPKEANFNFNDVVNDVGGVLANTTLAVAENGKIHDAQLRHTKSADAALKCKQAGDCRLVFWVEKKSLQGAPRAPIQPRRLIVIGA